MGREIKARERLVLIGIACGDEIKYITDLMTTGEKSNMVRKNKKSLKMSFYFVGDQSSGTRTRSTFVK